MRGGLLRDPEFLKLWAGQSISQIGSWITLTGLPMTAALTLHASPLEMGILSGAGASTVLVFGLFAGAWVDRLRRRPILIAADLGRAAVLAVVPAAAAFSRLTMEILYFVAAAQAVLTVLFDVSYQAYLPSLVSREHLLEGNSKLAVSESAAGVAGPALAGVLVQWLTAPIAILFDAVSFLASAFSIALIRRPEPEPERRPEPRIVGEIVEGLRAAWKHPVLRALAQRTATASFFLGFGSSLYILFAVRDLRQSPGMLGAVIAVGGASSLLGAMTAERLVRRFGFGRVFLTSVAVIGTASLLPPLAHGSPAMCALVLSLAQLGDVAWAIYTINETSLRQAVTPDALLGRVNSAMHLMSCGVLPIGAFAGGAIAQAIGIRATLFLGAAGFLVSTLWLVFSPIRKMRELPNLSEGSARHAT